MLLARGERSGPMYRRLASGLEELFARGELPSGCVLPSERALASMLRVSRTTVVAAYGRLQETGRVERRSGSGTRVVDAPGAGRAVVPATRPARLASRFLDASVPAVDLAAIQLPALPVVAEIAGEISTASYTRLMTGEPRADSRGLPHLRARIASLHTRSREPTVDDQILVTSGAQEALDLVAEGCLRRGEIVLVEAPAYRGALSAFARAGVRVEPVPSDRDGVLLPELARLAARWRPRALYLQASVRNPTGTSLSRDRHAGLLEIAARHDILVIDDRALEQTAFEDVRPLRASRPGDPEIIAIGSLNKLFWAGLRVGWIRAGADAVARLARLRGETHASASALAQHVAVDLLDVLPQANAERAEQLRAAHALLDDLLASHLPDWTCWDVVGGPSRWVRLPAGAASPFAASAQQHGVSVLPEAVFTPGGTADRHVRIPVGGPSGQLELGVRRLAAAWEEVRVGSRSG